MEHRHLLSGYGNAQLADIIVRGDMMDWVRMREEAKARPEVFDRLSTLVREQIQRAEQDDEFEGLSRYHVWKVWTDQWGNQYGTRKT